MPVPVNLNREIWLGNFAEDGSFTQKPAKIGLKDLTKHCLIVGMPGSGKTTLCFSILRQLWETYEIPFIVLEPAKTEYRGLKELPRFQMTCLFSPSAMKRLRRLALIRLKSPKALP